jgi:hypothetical protein
MTLRHFSISSATSLPKSSGEPPNTALPSLANCSFVWESASAAFTSLLSLVMIAADVFFGAPIPFLAPTFETELGLYQHTAAIGQSATLDRLICNNIGPG